MSLDDGIFHNLCDRIAITSGIRAPLMAIKSDTSMNIALRAVRISVDNSVLHPHDIETDPLSRAPPKWIVCSRMPAPL
eukprot:812873-Pleurochrysis_carterae.AAC.1